MNPPQHRSGKLANPQRTGIFSWMMFDWAAQPFATLLLTFVFAPYFANYVASSPAEGQQIWALALTTGGVIIALFAPIMGAMADISGPRKPWIAVFSVLVIVGSTSLYLATPTADAPVFLILSGFVLGLIGIEFATVFTNAMMSSLVTREELGKLSGAGWALGYLGGIVALVIVLGLMAANPETGKTLFGLTPIFGLDAASHEGTRASGPLTTLWYLIFVIPLFLFTPDAPKRTGKRVPLRQALKNLWQTLRELPRRKSYFAFLITSMIYRDGLISLFAFGGIYAVGVLGLSITQIGIFGILAAFTGAIGAFTGGHLDARFGPRIVVFYCCWLLVIACTIIVSTTNDTLFFFLPISSPNLPRMRFSRSPMD